MDFFEHQEHARRSTKRLIVLFAIAVVAVVVAVNIAATLIYYGFMAPTAARYVGQMTLPTGFYPTNTIVVLGLIFGGMWLETYRLRAGGAAVARMVGAREVDPSTRDLLDRRLLNIVEEMAIASGVPMPRVFVMDGESSINAFAAGHSINDAVVTVTHGTLTRLSRDELQGVVAHEFSHILNGDMKLNLRLMGVLFGLLIVAMAGRFLLEIGGRGRVSGGSRSGGSAVAVLFLGGLALWILGYIGVFFGRLIKASVSRQREFLADASAVQFTRNPDGIGGALRKIGGLSQQTGLGTRIDHPQAEALSHLFLGAARPSFARGLFATHPAIDERVHRIYGRTMELLPATEDAVALALGGLEPSVEKGPRSPIEFVQSSSVSVAPASASSQAEPMPAALSPVSGLMAASALAASQLSNEVGTVRPQFRKDDRKLDRKVDRKVDRNLDRDPDFSLDEAQRAVLANLHAAAQDATRAQLLVLALLVDKAVDLRVQQRTLVAEAYGAEGARLADTYHEDIQSLPPGARQPLADVAMPALRRLPPETRAKLLRVAHLLIAADGRLTVREFLLYSILRRRLGPDAGRAVPVRYTAIRELAPESSLVLSLVAQVRLPERPEHAFNAGAVLLKDVDTRRVDAAALQLDAVSAALDRLNQLAPLAKPILIKAATAVAFVDDRTNWKAASSLRMICAALDAPLPPQVLAVEAA